MSEQRVDRVGRFLEDGERECVYPTIMGRRCRVGFCVWRSQANDDEMDEPSRRWAGALADACEQLAEEPAREVARKLAEDWQLTGPELVDLARQLTQ